MMIFDSFRDFIRSLDRREFVLYSSLYVGFFLVLVLGFIVRHVYLVQEAQQKIKQLNNARRDVQKILTKFTQVDKQRKKIDLLLKDKSFYIQKYFQGIAQKSNIHQHATEKVSKQKVEEGYLEESLSITLTQVTTKQLSELLQDIEDEQRIYIKFVEITKTGNTRKINVAMTIATLIPQNE